MFHYVVHFLLLCLLSQHRYNVAAKPFHFSVGKRRPTINLDDPLSSEEVLLIQKSLVHGIPFNDLPEGLFEELVNSCKRVLYAKNSVIFKQGDTETDFLIVIQHGRCKILVHGQPLPDPYGTARPGSMIGELALLYNKQRSATVVAATQVSAFRLDRESFAKFMAYVTPEDEQLLKDELQEVDHVIDKVSGVKKRYVDGHIVRQFVPMRAWLWSRWKGTIPQVVWKTVLVNVLVSLGVSKVIHNYSHPNWAIGMLPDSQNHIISRLIGLRVVWTYLMTITTFILTFFLSQAYSLWRDFYSLTRQIQGRMNDLGLLIAAAATRDKNGMYTAEAKQLIDDTSSYMRLFHILMWATFSKRLKILLSDTGLRRMISRGLLSLKEYETLKLLPAQVGYPNACTIWILTRCLQAMKDGSLENDPVLREQIYIKILELRSTCAGIPHLLAAVIPLAYAHIVQILVDIFIFLSPFALYSEVGVWSTPAVALLTIFYSGLLDLSKLLLDPLDNDDFYNDSVNMDIPVLIRESNSGSTRWSQGAQCLPF
ncbi:unnamed protein product [Cylindrotheca closterium]|uniref:Cyclic nucleotide-binding domain-containing protein n=1 Tax=Cylindrotheca closterium TaxID=2856 RepID=A0AAD2FPE6_9STRA|nr:unnamed protein product [Cylindrotheca closterium]